MNVDTIETASLSFVFCVSVILYFDNGAYTGEIT